MTAGTLIPLLGFITLSLGLGYGLWRYRKINQKLDDE